MLHVHEFEVDLYTQTKQEVFLESMSEAKRNRSTLGELQITPGPGLGRRADCHVIRKTPLKRKARVKTAVCGETVSLRTPRKPQPPRTKRLRSTTVQEICVQVPATDDSLTTTSLVIKSNPLYSAGKQTKHTEDGVGGCTPCDGGRNPLFYGQRRNIRKTKEQEMITAIMDVAKYGERSVGRKTRSQSKSIVGKAKALLKRNRTSAHLEITKPKSPLRKGAFFLRARQRTD